MVPIKRFLLIALALAAGFACDQSNSERLFETAINHLHEERFDEAVQNFITLMKTHPNDSLVDDSLFWIAATYNYYLDEPERAIRYYRSFNKGFEDSEYYTEAMLELAKIYTNMDAENKERALLIHRKLQEDNPNPEEWEKTQYQIVRLHLDLNQHSLARTEMKRFLEKSDNPKYTHQIYSMIGYSYYIEGKFAFSEKAYKEAYEKYGNIYSALSLADVYQETGDLKKALATLRGIDRAEVQEDHLEKLIDNQIETLTFRISKLR